MEYKQLYACKNCRSFHAINPEKSTKGCPNCSGKLTYVPIPLNRYESMTAESRERFHKDFLEGRFPAPSANQPSQSLIKQEAKFVPQDSGWVKGAKLAAKLVFGLFIIAAIFLFVFLGGNPILALLSSVLVLCIGFLSVGMSMVFLNMASDIKAIRDYMTKK